MFAHLPVDVWLSILQHLHVEDILVLERVSRRFHSLIEQRTVWSDAYKRSLLPRPPGPFPTQPTRDLRSALVKSARLEKHWPPSPTQPPASILSLDLCRHAHHFSLVLDRWLFYTCIPTNSFHTNHGTSSSSSQARTPEILFVDLHSSDKRPYPVTCDVPPSAISFFTCVGTPSPDPDVDAGGLAFAVVEDRQARTVRIYRVALPYSDCDDLKDEDEQSATTASSGPVPALKLVKEIAACDVNLRDGAVMLAPGALVVQGHRVHYRQSLAHVWVMHTRSLALWKLPVCATTATDVPLSQLLTMHFTPTHLLAVLSTRASTDARDLFSFVPAIMEAYPLPLPETSGDDERPLQASHVFTCKASPGLHAQMSSTNREPVDPVVALRKAMCPKANEQDEEGNTLVLPLVYRKHPCVHLSLARLGPFPLPLLSHMPTSSYVHAPASHANSGESVDEEVEPIQGELLVSSLLAIPKLDLPRCCAQPFALGARQRALMQHGEAWIAGVAFANYSYGDAPSLAPTSSQFDISSGDAEKQGGEASVKIPGLPAFEALECFDGASGRACLSIGTEDGVRVCVVDFV